MKKRHLLIEISLAAFTIFIMLWIFVPKFLGSQNIILPTYFPDPAVRSAVRTALGVVGDEPFTKKQAAEYNGELKIENCKSIKGLELFPNLSSLILESHTLSMMDLSKHPKLEHLILNSDNIESVNTDFNPHLKEFTLQIDPAKRINPLPVDISFIHNPKLNYVSLINCPLNSIDFTANPELFSVAISNINTTHRLNSLNISHNHKIASLFVSGHDLEALDVYHLHDLYILRCSNNNLLEITLPANSKINHIECSQNKLTRLDVSTAHELEILSCFQNKLTELILPQKISNLKYLRCFDNHLLNLDVSRQIHLKTIQAYKNPLQQISFSPYPIQWVETDNIEWNHFSVSPDKKWPMAFIVPHSPAYTQNQFFSTRLSTGSSVVRIENPIMDKLSEQSKRSPYMNDLSLHLHPELKNQYQPQTIETSILKDETYLNLEPELSPNLMDLNLN